MFVSALGYRMDQVPVVAGVITTGVNFPNAVYPGAGAPGGGAPRGSLPTLGGDVPVVGDWDGNGSATIGVKRANTFFLRNSNSSGVSDVALAYGDPGDLGLSGDWDGNGTDTVGVSRQGAFYLRNSNTHGRRRRGCRLRRSHRRAMRGRLGRQRHRPPSACGRRGTLLPAQQHRRRQPGHRPRATAIPATCRSWATGTATAPNRGRVPRPARFYLRNSNTRGAADVVVGFGDPSDVPVVGDWDGTVPTRPACAVGRSSTSNDGSGTALASAVAEYGGPTTVG